MRGLHSTAVVAALVAVAAAPLAAASAPFFSDGRYHWTQNDDVINSATTTHFVSVPGATGTGILEAECPTVDGVQTEPLKLWCENQVVNFHDYIRDAAHFAGTAVDPAGRAASDPDVVVWVNAFAGPNGISSPDNSVGVYSGTPAWGDQSAVFTSNTGPACASFDAIKGPMSGNVNAWRVNLEASMPAANGVDLDSNRQPNLADPIPFSVGLGLTAASGASNGAAVFQYPSEPRVPGRVVCVKPAEQNPSDAGCGCGDPEPELCDVDDLGIKYLQSLGVFGQTAVPDPPTQAIAVVKGVTYYALPAGAADAYECAAQA